MQTQKKRREPLEKYHLSLSSRSSSGIFPHVFLLCPRLCHCWGSSSSSICSECAEYSLAPLWNHYPPRRKRFEQTLAVAAAAAVHCSSKPVIASVEYHFAEGWMRLHCNSSSSFSFSSLPLIVLLLLLLLTSSHLLWHCTDSSIRAHVFAPATCAPCCCCCCLILLISCAFYPVWQGPVHPASFRLTLLHYFILLPLTFYSGFDMVVVVVVSEKKKYYDHY